jgi:hypothetical protein
MKPVIRKYNIKLYNFREMVQNVFECKKLENIHVLRKDLFPGETILSKPWPFNETTTGYQDTFYGKYHDGWEDMIASYELFIKNEIKPLFSEDFLYQRFPSFRVHLPGLKAVNKWHYDSDEDHRHPEGEMNFHFGVTECFDTNAMWVESEPRKEDFRPINIKYGEFVQFDGNKCTHGNKTNTTQNTRISFDFRVLPFSKYKVGKNKTSVTLNTKFEEGVYYKKYV